MGRACGIQDLITWTLKSNLTTTTTNIITSQRNKMVNINTRNKNTHIACICKSISYLYPNALKAILTYLRNKYSNMWVVLKSGVWYANDQMTRKFFYHQPTKSIREMYFQIQNIQYRTKAPTYNLRIQVQFHLYIVNAI